jgi:hypothetical protein
MMGAILEEVAMKRRCPALIPTPFLLRRSCWTLKCKLSAVLVGLCLTCSGPAPAQTVPADYQAVLTYLNRTGDFAAGVFKVNVPRNDVQVSVAGVRTPTPFGLGGWVAMTKGDGGREVLMGDLVLLQDEVNPVMTALLDRGIEITALHNHFFWDQPSMFYMHVHGVGSAMDLARNLKPALDLIGHVGPIPPPASNSAPIEGTLDTEKIAAIAGHRGDQTGAVYKITIGREDLSVREHGATINARMGLNTWAAFYGSNANAVVAGDVAMLESEVTPVLKALRKNGLDVVAIHHHMTSDRPMIIFLHYWGKGPAEKLAAGFKAALAELGNAVQPAAAH